MSIGSPARLSAIDAHTAGGVVRLIVSGLPGDTGATMPEKAASFGRRAGRLCDAISREPRGHGGVTLGVLTAPAALHSDAGLLFRRADRFLPFSSEAIIAVATIALERQLIVPAQQGRLQFDTEAGPVSVTYDIEEVGTRPSRVREVRLVHPDAYVLAAGVDITVRARPVKVDIAFGGEWLAIADAESAGVPLTRLSNASLRETGALIADAVEKWAGKLLAERHESPPDAFSLRGVVVTGPAAEGEPSLRAAVVRRDGTVEHWPSGTALVAVLSVLTEMGLTGTGDGMELEGLVGTRLRGRIVRQRRVADQQAIAVEVMGSSWIIAEHDFVLHGDDPLRNGIAG